MNVHNQQSQIPLSNEELVYLQALVWETIHLELNGPAHQLAKANGFESLQLERLRRETKPYVVNLVREVATSETTAFARSLGEGFDDSFCIASWEAIYALLSTVELGSSQLAEYLRNKSANLRPAFEL